MMMHKCDSCIHKGEHREMGFRSFGICRKGADLIKAEMAYRAKECPYKQTTSRADHIRAMSDEELAWLLVEFRVDAYACAVGDEGALPRTQESIVEWLREPAGV